MAFIRTDVTAVKFHEDFIFAGIGSCTNIYRRASLEALQRLITLQGQKIYGFVASKCGQKILCFGGKQFTVLSFSGSSREKGVICSRLFEPVVSDDWIHSGIWIDEKKVALLSAHNTVQFWDISSQTLLKQIRSKENSILYSGLLVLLEDEVLVLAGTVFSEVIIHCCNKARPLQHLKGHRGVIFSISCDPEKEIIITTSDDRSLRIWSPNTESKHTINTKEYWQHTKFVCKHELYGHLARVMRSCISNEMVVSVGEDGAICFWDFNGKPLKKNMAHQNSPIWSVDADNDSLVTGGGDCGIMVHPLSVAVDFNQNVLEKNADVKKVLFTARRNVVMMTDDHIIYYNVKGKDKLEYKLKHTSTYKMLSMSICRQIIAVCDMDGNLNVFIENCKEDCLQNVIKAKLELGKILSMHWGDNRHLVLCSQSGAINVIAKGNEVENVSSFILPVCKERWLTAVAIDAKINITILGDRCGNIHVYMKGEKEPIKSFRKVHGRYGPTSINIKDNEVITTGRDGTIRYFSIRDDQVMYMSNKHLEFQWVEKFLDRENTICGFQERDFVVYDIRNSNKILEVACGGGHRSWDAIRLIDKINDEYDEFIKLIYIKNCDVNIATFQLSKIVSRNIVNGSHSKEINCLKCCNSDIDTSNMFYISGGEDTTLRISNVDSRMEFIDRIVYKHLSNIRALELYKLKDDRILVISAGGRAQICVNIINFEKKADEIKVIFEEVIDYQIRGTDKERKGTQNWRNCSIDFDPETRVMDIEAIKIDNKTFNLFIGCSDAFIRIYNLNVDDNTELKLINEVKYHKTCILKTHEIKFKNQTILVTCTTRGEVAFWDTSNVSNKNFIPFYTTTTNKSGINSIATKVLSDGEILIATGGDDNAIHLIVINVQPNLTSAKLKSSFHLDYLHSSQITGLCFSEEYLVSASIDQRISLLKWRVEDGILCQLVSQVFCDVADVQGMEYLDCNSATIKICVFGKGMEVIELKKPS